MKKILLVTVLMMLCGISSANAFTSCEGGTIITRNKYTDANAPAGCHEATCPSETKTFCMSDKGMTWWAALTWCDAQGGHLATFSSMCPGIVPIVENKDVGACPALQGLGEQYVYAWSAYPSTDKCAIMVDLLNGKAEGCTRASLYHPVTKTYRALCE